MPTLHLVHRKNSWLTAGQSAFHVNGWMRRPGIDEGSRSWRRFSWGRKGLGSQTGVCARESFSRVNGFVVGTRAARPFVACVHPSAADKFGSARSAIRERYEEKAADVY